MILCFPNDLPHGNSEVMDSYRSTLETKKAQIGGQSLFMPASKEEGPLSSGCVHSASIGHHTLRQCPVSTTDALTKLVVFWGILGGSGLSIT